MEKSKTVVLLLIILHVHFLKFTIGDNYVDYSDFGNGKSYDGDFSDVRSTTPPTTTNTVKPISGKLCGSMTNEFCVKRDQCGTHTGKIIIDLTTPQGVCDYMETCCQQSNINQSVSIVQNITCVI